MMKKILATLMCVLLILPVVSMFTVAVNDDTVYGYVEGVTGRPLRFPEDEIYIPKSNYTKPRMFYSNNSSDNYLFSSQLNNTQK